MANHVKEVLVMDIMAERYSGIIIMSLTPISSSNKDIRRVPSMQSSYLEK